MLSSLVVNQQKFVVILDDVGLEQHHIKIIKSWISEVNNSADIHVQTGCQPVPSPEQEQFVIMPPLSKMILQLKVEEIVSQIKTLKHSEHVKQLFVWITTKNIQHQFIVPFVIHLANEVIHFEGPEILTVLNRKSTGSVAKKTYQYKYESPANKFDVKEISKGKRKEFKEEKPVDPSQLTTFKIGGFSEAELKAKTELQMPYEKVRITNTEKKEGTFSQIHYVPDDVDDFDEDDPDDDLDI